MVNKAIILVSGGLDSATCLAIAKDQGYECYALSFDYGQSHRIELEAARSVAKAFNVSEHKIFQLPIQQLGGSTLANNNGAQQDTLEKSTIYVPVRNTLFLTIALTWADILQAQSIFIGISIVDYEKHPDYRPEFIQAFQQMANTATTTSPDEQSVTIETPLIYMSKAETIQTGIRLGVDYSITISCYIPDDEEKACGNCDACICRKKGFEEANISDPTRYK